MSLSVNGPSRLEVQAQQDVPVFRPPAGARLPARYTGVPLASPHGGRPPRSPFKQYNFTIREALDEWPSLTPLQPRATYYSVPEELRNEQLNCWVKSSAPGKYYSLSHLGVNKLINYTDFDGVTRVVEIPMITINEAGLKRIMEIRNRNGKSLIRPGDEGDYVWCHFRDLEEKRQAALARRQAPPAPPRVSASYDK